jgi:hypothetical protein
VSQLPFEVAELCSFSHSLCTVPQEARVIIPTLQVGSVVSQGGDVTYHKATARPSRAWGGPQVFGVLEPTLLTTTLSSPSMSSSMLCFINEGSEADYCSDHKVSAHCQGTNRLNKVTASSQSSWGSLYLQTKGDCSPNGQNNPSWAEGLQAVSLPTI